jgi:hypothetical protein
VAGFERGGGLTLDQCALTLRCDARFAPTCSGGGGGGGPTVECGGGAGDEFEFSGCEPACQLDFAAEAYEFRCGGEAGPLVPSGCLSFAADADLSVAVAARGPRECVVGCREGYFASASPPVSVNATCSAARAGEPAASMQLAGCVAGCTMPVDVALYDVSGCKVVHADAATGTNFYDRDCNVAACAPAAGGVVQTAECPSPGGAFVLTGCGGTCKFDPARIDAVVYRGSCVSDSASNVDAAVLESSCAYACAEDYAGLPGGVTVTCDAAGFVSVSGCAEPELCTLRLATAAARAFKFTGRCSTLDSGGSLIDLAACSVSCADGFVTKAGLENSTQLATCSEATGQVVGLDSDVCVPQCAFPRWAAAGATLSPFAVDGECAAFADAANSALSTAAACTVVCADGYFESRATCASPTAGTCTVDLDVEGGPLDQDVVDDRLVCGVLQNELSSVAPGRQADYFNYDYFYHRSS